MYACSGSLGCAKEGSGKNRYQDTTWFQNKVFIYSIPTHCASGGMSHVEAISPYVVDIRHPRQTCCSDNSHCPTHVRRMILPPDRHVLSLLRMDISSKIERGLGANSNFKYEATSSSYFATQTYYPAEELHGLARPCLLPYFH